MRTVWGIPSMPFWSAIFFLYRLTLERPGPGPVNAHVDQLAQPVFAVFLDREKT